MKTSLILCLLLATAPVYAETWVRYTQTEEANLYYDKHRVIKMGSTAMIWDLHDLKVAVKDASGNGYSSVLYATEYNCRMGQRRILSEQKVAGAMGSGKVISEVSAAGEWMEVSPKSAGGKLLLSACDLQ